MERVYIDVDSKGNIIACATTPVNNSNINIEVDNLDEFSRYMTAYRYVSDGLILDHSKKRKIEKEEEEENSVSNELSDKERIEALESAILEIILGGDSS